MTRQITSHWVGSFRKAARLPRFNRAKYVFVPDRNTSAVKIFQCARGAENIFLTRYRDVAGRTILSMKRAV